MGDQTELDGKYPEPLNASEKSAVTMAKKLESSRPASERLGNYKQESHSPAERSKIFEKFRELRPREVSVSLGDSITKLVYEPVLLSENTEVGDNELFDVVWQLKKNFEVSDDISLSQEENRIAKAEIEKLQKDRWYNVTAKYIEDYEDKILQVEKMPLKERLQLMNANQEHNSNEDSEQYQLLRERIDRSPLDTKNLLSELPPEKYGEIDESGNWLWFGLPVKREPEWEEIYLQRSGKTIKRIKEGSHIISVFSGDETDSDFWLAWWIDGHSDYFNNLIEEKKMFGEPKDVVVPPLKDPNSQDAVSRDILAASVSPDNEKILPFKPLSHEKLSEIDRTEKQIISGETTTEAENRLRESIFAKQNLPSFEGIVWETNEWNEATAYNGADGTLMVELPKGGEWDESKTIYTTHICLLTGKGIPVDETRILGSVDFNKFENRRGKGFIGRARTRLVIGELNNEGLDPRFLDSRWEAVSDKGNKKPAD